MDLMDEDNAPMCHDCPAVVKGGGAAGQFAALVSARHVNGLYSTVHESGRVASTPAEGLDDHLGHRSVPQGRGVVGEAGDAEHGLGPLRPSLRRRYADGVIPGDDVGVDEGHPGTGRPIAQGLENSEALPR